jgi:hypothetical protein
MANTFELIASSTVGASPVTTITFSSIPSTYTDLCLKLSVRSNSASFREVWINPNGSSANGTSRILQGSGSAAVSYTATRFQAFGATNPTGSTASTFSSIDVYIPNYAGSTNKSLSADGVEENNATNAYAELSASLWSNTAAITSLDIVLSSGDSFVQYSTAYLYGVKNA